jgi:bifunctional non-homologous end joining protein LigD
VARAVAARRTTETVVVGERTLVLSNRDKVLWPQDGYTKGDLIAYYRSVTRWIVPHLEGRPLTLQRYPNGIDGMSFFEKNAPRGLPEWIPTVAVATDSGRRAQVDFVLCNDEPTLVYLANLATIVLHVWTSRVASLDVPDFVFFDLDPFDGCTLATLAKVALGLREALGEIGLATLIKSSGGSGLHVAVPLEPRYTYDVARHFAELVARTLHGRMPALTTLERVPAKRPAGTVYLDYVQVGKGKTLVAPYSVRARAKAPVSLPLDWSEIEAMARKRAKDTEAEFARFTLKNVPALLEERGDLWGAGSWRGQRLEPALKAAQTKWRENAE